MTLDIESSLVYIKVVSSGPAEGEVFKRVGLEKNEGGLSGAAVLNLGPPRPGAGTKGPL